MKFSKVALFGANGQVGNPILHALIACKEQTFDILAFIPPNSKLKFHGDTKSLKIHRVDLSIVSAEELSPLLQGVDVAVSALGGSLLPRQGVLQDAAALARVTRFYPSEFGMHQIVRLPDTTVGFLHPEWDLKMKCLEDCIKHSAIRDGRMSYTVIGCAEFFDVPKEPKLCPWLDTEADEYTVQVVGDATAKIDYTSIHDVAAYLVASLCQPAVSENQTLGFRSDYISYDEVASLLHKYSGKRVTLNVTSSRQAADIIQNPDLVPNELKGGSTFPVDFWLSLRLVQGQGRFWRPPGQLHNHLFPQVQTRSFEAYFSHLFGIR